MTNSSAGLVKLLLKMVSLLALFIIFSSSNVVHCANNNRGNSFSNNGLSFLKIVGIFGAGITIGVIMSSSPSVMKSLDSEMQIISIDDIPPFYYKEKKILTGRVSRVIDGDTVRFQHQPGWLSSSQLSSKSFTIRLAAIDTPEIAKPNRAGGGADQPLGQEAKQFVEDRLLSAGRKGKKDDPVVTLKILKRDRFNRVLGVIRYSSKHGDGSRKDVDIAAELLEEGLAVVYRQGGAEYDGRLEEYTTLERKAQRAKRGLWGLSSFQSPAEYKAKLRSSTSAPGPYSQ